MNRTFEEIDRDRRRLCGVAPFSLAAAQLGLIPSASAQPATSNELGLYLRGFSRIFQPRRSRRVERQSTFCEKGTGRPLLLLHGYPETRLTWHKVAPQLAGEFSVVVPDLRGCGQSGVPDSGERHEHYSFRAMARDQIDVMRHYGHERLLAPRTKLRSKTPVVVTGSSDEKSCGPAGLLGISRAA